MTSQSTPGFMQESDSMEALLKKDDSFISVNNGDIVRGEVVRVKNGELYVSIGNKIDGVVAQKDMKTLSATALTEMEIGTPLLVYILDDGEGRDGFAELSIDRAKAESMWVELQDSYARQKPTIGRISGFNKGGMTVDLGGLAGFVPLSHVAGTSSFKSNNSYPGVLEDRLGENVELDIIELDRKQGRLVLSERSVLDKKRAEMKAQVLQGLAPGVTKKGCVKNITNFGAFVDIGGIEGLVHISELSWSRVRHPSEVVTVGQEVEVEILEIDKDKDRIRLSMRNLQQPPWDSVSVKYEEGQVLGVTITQLQPFGAFARMEDGIEGLIHVSELSADRIDHPNEIVASGDVVDVKILGIDYERKRISLSMRQAGWNDSEITVWQA
jgi:small subunit ribosomal protein S1